LSPASPAARQALALQARIVLACAEGTTNKKVAAALGVWPQTVNRAVGGRDHQHQPVLYATTGARIGHTPQERPAARPPTPE